MNATSLANGDPAASESTIPESNPVLLSTDVLLKALEEAKRHEARIKKQIEEMQRRQLSAQEESRILSKLIALRSGKAPEDPVNKTILVCPPSRRDGAVDARSGHSLLEAVIAILEDANRPIHISDLMRLLGEKDVQIPGSGTQANLISHLRRDKRIVRPSRGMYGLAVWGLAEMPSQSRRRRRRRRAT